MRRYVERVNAYLDTWLQKEGYQRILTEFVEENHLHYLRVYIDFLDGALAENQSAAAVTVANVQEAAQGKASLDVSGETPEEVPEAASAEEALPRGIGINDCAKVSRRLSKWLDQEDFISEMYTLEVCSRGFLEAPDTEASGEDGE